MGSWIFYNTVKYYFSSPILLRAFTFETSVFAQLDINKGHQKIDLLTLTKRPMDVKV